MPAATFERQFTPDHLARLAGIGGYVHCRDLDALARHSDALALRVLVTGWGTPRLAAGLVQTCPSLELIAHCAGTVRALIDPGLFGRGVRVTNSATQNAIPVAEFMLSWILRWNKKLHYWEQAYRGGCDGLAIRHRFGHDGVGNRGQVIGVIAASRVGRHLLGLLRHFDFEPVVYDPHLSAEDIAAMGAVKADLDTLLARSDIVTVNAPLLPETRHMIGRSELARMRDGALLINTARGGLVDHDALLAELRAGRLTAVLDVTEPEPLPADSPFFGLPNAVITPHVAGSLGREVHRLTDNMLDQVALYLAEGRLTEEVTAELLETAA